jgi:DNA modification methylase
MRRNDEAIKHQLRNNKAPTSITSISEFFDDEDEPLPTPIHPSTSSSPQPGPVINGPTKVYLSRQFVHGDCIELMKTIAPETFHHIVCDPPYGIDLDFMDLKNQDRVEATHEVEDNIDLIEEFLLQAYNVLKPNGFLVMFYDLNHHEKILKWATEGPNKAGFKVQRWPIVWVKEHPCKNQAASYNFTKNVEFAYVMRKGNATLIKPQLSCVISAEGSVEKKMYDNPFAKPFAVWKFIYDAIATKGQTVFDPFMGEGSACRAAVNLGLTPYGCELDDHHYNKAILGVKETYKLLLGETVEFR